MAFDQAAPDRSTGSEDTANLDWDAIYADLAPRVYNFFRFRLGTRDRYRRELAGFSTWLFTIARNVLVDHVQGRRSHLPIAAALNAAAAGTTQSLSERERELIALKYGAGLTNRLIARLSDLSESHVGSILHRVVRLLREKW